MAIDFTKIILVAAIIVLGITAHNLNNAASYWQLRAHNLEKAAIHKYREDCVGNETPTVSAEGKISIVHRNV